jgi:hypothetical protein
MGTQTGDRTSAGAAVATPPSQVRTALTPLEATRPAPATAARAAAPQKEHKTTTLILGRTHLFALAALLVAIIAGMGGLAIAVFKKGTLQQQVPFLGTLPGSTPSAAPQDPAAAQSTPPAAPSTPPEAPAATQSTPTPSTAPPVVTGPVAATAGAGTAKPTASSVPPPSGSAPPKTPAAPPKTVAVPATLPPPPVAASTPATSAAPGPVDPAAAKAARGAEPVPPATPAKNGAPPLLFNDVRLLVADADNKGRERQAVLQLADGKLSVVDRNGGGPITSIRYSDVVGAFYSRSKQPKWRDASGKEVESKVDLGRMGFLRGDRNWLILLTAGEPIIIRLEDSNLQKILPAVQERTGVEVKR